MSDKGFVPTMYKQLILNEIINMSIFLNEQNIQIDVSPRKTVRRPASPRKGAPQH